jgi:hypothetical protein
LQLAGDSHPSFTVGKVSTTSTVSGDTAKVKLVASGTSGSGAWSVNGSCFTVPEQDEFASGSSETSSGSSPSSTGVTGTVLTPGSQPGTTGSTTGCGLGVLALAAVPDSGAATNDQSSSSITVVNENGRWFVSPVGTVLDLLDQGISGLTQRTVYTLMNIPDEITPDGAVTLGQPVALQGAFGDYVYTYAGHQGEQLLGQATVKTQLPDEFLTAEARVFGPDGKELDSGFGLLQGQAITLPADGTYKVVLQAFGTSATVTIWDAADAPAAAKHSPFPGESCTSSGGGGEVCTSNGAPNTIPGNDGSSPPTSAMEKSSSATSSTLPVG